MLLTIFWTLSLKKPLDSFFVKGNLHVTKIQFRSDCQFWQNLQVFYLGSFKIKMIAGLNRILRLNVPLRPQLTRLTLEKTRVPTLLPRPMLLPWHWSTAWYVRCFPHWSRQHLFLCGWLWLFSNQLVNLVNTFEQFCLRKNFIDGEFFCHKVLTGFRFPLLSDLTFKVLELLTNKNEQRKDLFKWKV